MPGDALATPADGSVEQDGDGRPGSGAVAVASELVPAPRALKQQRGDGGIDGRLNGARLRVDVDLRIVPGEDVVGGVFTLRGAGERVHQHAAPELQVASLSLTLDFHAARLSLELDDLEERGKRDALHCYLCTSGVTGAWPVLYVGISRLFSRIRTGMTLPVPRTDALAMKS